MPFRTKLTDTLDFARRWHGREEALGDALAAELPRYGDAAAARDFDTAVIFASEAVDLIRAVKPAAAIVADIVAEAQAVLARASGAVIGPSPVP